MTARILVDNFFNVRIYPEVGLSSSENTDLTALLGSGRRAAQDAWTSVTPNLAAWNKARCGVLRGADMVVLDRPHNLLGKTVTLDASSDDFTTTDPVFTGLLPTTSAAGRADDTYGVVTPEGVWLKKFGGHAGFDWRMTYAAMGTGLKPIVPGLWVGLSYSPGYPTRPHQPQGLSELIVEETESDLGWRGVGRPAKRRQGRLLFRFTTFEAYEVADWHIQRIAERRPFWAIPDEGRADHAVLAVLPRGTVGPVIEPSWAYPVLELPWVELDPEVA